MRLRELINLAIDYLQEDGDMEVYISGYPKEPEILYTNKGERPCNPLGRFEVIYDEDGGYLGILLKKY